MRKQSTKKRIDFDRHLDDRLMERDFAERFRKTGDARGVALQLTTLRKKAGLSQAELARRVGTSQQQISRLESPKYEGHSLSMLRRVAEVLGAGVSVQMCELEPRERLGVAEGAKDYGQGKEKRITGDDNSAPESNRLHGRMIEEIVRRIVASVRPLRIVLFGSAAKGGMGPDSDLDLLVIMPDDAHRRRTTQAIYRSLSKLGIPKDVVVATQSDMRRHGSNPSLIIHPAVYEGKVLYRAED
jgi:transcriptional regulator with XRE-family HTH domain